MTFNCSKTQSQNTAYGFEQAIYDRNGDKTMNIMSGLFVMIMRY